MSDRTTRARRGQFRSAGTRYWGAGQVSRSECSRMSVDGSAGTWPGRRRSIAGGKRRIVQPDQQRPARLPSNRELPRTIANRELRHLEGTRSIQIQIVEPDCFVVGHQTLELGTSWHTYDSTYSRIQVSPRPCGRTQ